MRPVDLVEFLDHLALLSGEAILPFFRNHISVTDKAGKGVFDPVTEADRAAELVIRREIKQRFPQHGILGEEFGGDHEEAEFVWVVDPIDGTRSFICGLPVWGTLIGLKRFDAAVLGLMHQPYTRERFFGDGARAWLKGPSGERKLSTRATTDLAEATLMTTTPALFKGSMREAYDRVENTVRLARYGTDCYAYAMLASGHVDLVIETGLKAYDIVALIPIIEGAGGVITDFSGGSVINGGDVVVAANHQLHEKALKLLNR
ncbi:MAG TPA: histidinol-phosphatase [Beijerinckiaceae bacterium]|nr:histidinol-phosphatase [Beijerinckiaceae bacterium]